MNIVEDLYEELEIENIEIVEEPIEMYDIEVDDDHTFCITNSDIVSHNCNSMVKAITIPALKTDTAMIIINHVYDDPSSLFTQKIKNQGGGKGLQYMSRLTLQCDRVLEKEEDKNADGFYSGTNLKFFTVKNMLCRPSLETKIYLDFKKGFINKYDGLFDEAVRGGFIISPSQGYYQVPSWSDPEKKWRQSQLEANEEVWNTFIEDFDKWSLEELKYSSAAKEAIAEHEKQITEQNDEL